MSILERKFSKSQNETGNDSGEPPIARDGICFRWYFMTVGYAMGHQVYSSICKCDEFQILGGGREFSPGKLAVRYYVGSGLQKSPQGQFTGFEIDGDAVKKPVTTLSEAVNILARGGDKAALIAILEDSRFDDINAGFRDYLNRKYIEIGALPIVRLLCTDSGDDAKHLLNFFSFREENTPFLARNKPADFFMPEPQMQSQENPVIFVCANCTQRIAIDESYRGERVACPTCGEEVTVPLVTDASGLVQTAVYTGEISIPPRSSPPPIPTSVAPPVITAPEVQPLDEELPILDPYLYLRRAGTIGGVLFISGAITGLVALKAIAAVIGLTMGLGGGVFLTICAFAPNRTLTHPAVVARIGTSNPTVARIACAIVAALFYLYCLTPFLIKHE